MPPISPFQHAFAPLCLVLATLCLGGCEFRTSVRGTVVDVRGERLPGVAVTVRGVEAQAVTTGVGEYALRCPPGPAILDFSKTGYTPGRLDLSVPESGAAQATEVRLWPLPGGQGVYLFEDFRYHDLTRTEARPYRLPERGAVWASRVPAARKTADDQPLIIYYLLPAFDAVLHRVRPADGTPPQAEAGSDYTEPIWVAERLVASQVIPVDEPDRLLLELRPSEPLEPGTYAVGWGALDGYVTTHPYVYLFEVLAPGDTEATEVVPPTADGAPAAESPGAEPGGAGPEPISGDADDNGAPLEG